MIDNEKIVSGLNELLEANYDAEQGFSNAAENCDNARLKSFFRNKSSQRNRFCKDIKNEIVRLGGTPAEYGTVAGFMHRAWIDVKTAFSTNDDESVLEACETGEKSILDDYNEFLSNNTVASHTRTMIENQRNEIAKTHGKVRSLENQFDS